jgi:5'-methylthioadenosine phosphorylase
MLAIIGGTGLQNLDELSDIKEHEVNTPFGPPSAPIVEATYGGARIAFLPRHGRGHTLLPSEINYRANIYALKSVGVTHVIGVSAVGSLRPEFKPGDIAFPSQYIDFTKGRRNGSFFGEGVVVHISTAEPICPALMDSVHLIAAKEVSERGVHKGMTYGCVEGPRLGTRAESYFLRNAGCGLVGMTNIPEAFLAREAQICYASLCVVTDYDSWLDDPTQHVTAEMVLELYGKSLGDVKNVLRHVAVQERNNSCPLCRSLPSALVTPLEDVGAEKRQMMQMLLR